MKKTQLPNPSPPLAKILSSTTKVIKEERKEKVKIEPNMILLMMRMIFLFLST